MTIEEIKEIRATVLPTEQEYFDAHSVEMVDTLLAEVGDLNILNGENKIIIGAYTRQKERYDVCYRREFEAKRQLKAAESEITELYAALSKTNKKLTIATEALERIHNCQEYYPCGCGLAATNALERIEG